MGSSLVTCSNITNTLLKTPFFIKYNTLKTWCALDIAEPRVLNLGTNWTYEVIFLPG